MTNTKFSTEHRDDVLNSARRVCEKAQRENRELTVDEQQKIDGAIDDAREINEKLAADAKARQTMSQLDSMARTASGILPGDNRRLSFSKSMASDAAAKIMPPGGQKALSTSGTVVVAQEFAGDPVKLGQPPTSLLSVLPVITQVSGLFSYLRQSVRTNNAAIVAEGAVKPTSVYSVVRVDDKLDVVAHLSEAVPRYWFVDNPSLEQFLSNELTYGLSLAVEAMAIADIAGASGIQLNAYSTSVLQTLRKSVTKLEANGYPPATFVLHPTDWEAIELALLSTSSVEFQGLPLDPVARTLWGLAVTVTNAQTAGVAHTLAQGSVGLNTDTAGVSLAYSETSNSDDWSKNMIRARCEGRYATSIFQPLGVVQSDLTA